MKKQWRRLLFAAFISSTVFAGTWIWYQSMASTNASHGNEKPLAYVGKVVDDIQRRPASRLLWQLVNSGEPLYNGEALRTSEHGEVRVQFVDSDRYLDLEPESLIVIKKSEGEIALDLMEGSLFVNAAQANKNADKNSDKEASAAPSFVLNSANGQVDLSTASASLSKGQGNSVDVQVLEGKASVKTKDGQHRDLTSGSMGAVGDGGLKFDKNSLKIVSPLPQKSVAMNVDDMQPLPFQWSGFPADAQVSLMLGETRKDLKEVGKTQKPGDTQLQALVPIGKHYWKLVAKNNTGTVIAESPVYRTEVVARYASTVVFPEANADVPAPQFPYDMNFKWQNGEDVRAVTLEVWADPSLKKKISTMNLTKEESTTLPALPAGTYFWRVTSYYENTDKAIVGKIQHFNLKAAPKVAPESKSVQVSFTMPEADHEQIYTTPEPHLNMTWNADKAQNVSNWRVTLEAENGESALNKQVTVPTNHIDTPVAKPGRYIASIEALDKDGQVLGKTSATMNVSPAPMLPAADFIPAEGSLKAREDGKIQLEWSQIEGAKEYSLSIQRNGKELKKMTYKTTSTSLRNLLPGEYDVQISAVDANNRAGQAGPLRKLIVPDQSNVRAPAMKKIQVN